jgi:hypothetical protein
MWGTGCCAHGELIWILSVSDIFTPHSPCERIRQLVQTGENKFIDMKRIGKMILFVILIFNSFIENEVSLQAIVITFFDAF